MFKNVYYDTKNSLIHLWEQIDGKNNYSKISWVPYVYIGTPVGKSLTIDGLPADRMTFNTYQDYYQFCKNHSVNVYENNARPEIQFLTEYYHKIPDEDIIPPKLLIYYIDIEVNYSKETGFPKASEARDPVCLISIRNSQTGKTVTFGEKVYSGSMKNMIYVYCPDERELLRKFFMFMNKYPADVISGWNINDFDLTYLINRDIRINNGKYYKKMSATGVVRTWESKRKMKRDKSMNIDIAGTSILDYMEVYKWYTPHNLESYSLDYVSKFELEKGKLDYSKEADDLSQLYENNWDLYVDYNIIDCKRVNDIGRKLGYIRLIQSLSLLTKAQMKYFNVMTQLIEGAMLCHYRRNNLCAPYFAGGTQRGFEAAYVKEPQKGKHAWLFSVDITSSYPSHMIALNMSTETYYGRVRNIQEEQVIRYCNNKEFPEFELSKRVGNKMIVGNKNYRPYDDKILKMDDVRLKQFNLALQKGLLAIAPCGSIFKTSKPGVIASVVRHVFEKRAATKKRMYNSADGDERERLKAFQLALKILINAVFGILAVPYSRYYNTNIAEAITSCGRYTIKSGERFCNEIMNEPDEGLMSVIEGIKNG
jgi:DNA polymerase elongation subunit (family B)